MYKIIKVKEYNDEQEQKYNQDVNDWKPNEGGFPFLPMYLFMNEETGTKHHTGYVAILEGEMHLYARTKEEAEARIKREIKNNPYLNDKE